MKRLVAFRFACVCAVLCAFGGSAGASPSDAFVVDYSRSPHAVLRPLSFDAVQWTNGFWAERHRQLCEVTLDESWKLLADPAAGHVLENFRLAARPGAGGYAGTTWQDEWVYKWIEAAACVWRQTHDPALAHRMDEAIALIAAAQQPDGYLSTMPIVSGKPRFQNANDHEIYNMGHLLTAAVVHHRMTGGDRLLGVAKRAADFLCVNLGATVEPYMAHNPSAIMGLVELYRLTADRKYLACAQLIVDRRGTRRAKGNMWSMEPGLQGKDVIQDRVPVRDSTEVVGHNVFFTYLYTGASDLLAENNDTRLSAALDRLWVDLTQRKMFINGGVSAVPRGLSNFAPVIEAAGAPYQLPNATCYNETCGQIGVFMWGHRMLANRPDAQFADVMEREMFNGFLPCMGLDGRSWFYRAVLRRYDEDYKSTGWTDLVAREQPGRTLICCPSNLLRTLAQLSAYFYSVDDTGGLWVHHYGGTKVAYRLPSGGEFGCDQITDYPWSGEVKIVIRKAPGNPVALRLRVPGWAGGGKLAVNGDRRDFAPGRNGYLTIERSWKTGDTITLSLPMDAQLMTADPRVEETRNQVAVMRGPVVYCVESSDLPSGIKVPSVFLPHDAKFESATGVPGLDRELARSTVILCGPGRYRPESVTASLYRPMSREPLKSFGLTLVPYYAWANRGRSAMSIWLPVAIQP